MGASHQVIGNTVCAWDDDTPLIWTMSETSVNAIDQYVRSYLFDLTKLADGYDHKFLLNLKDLLMARRRRVALDTIKTEYGHLHSLLLKMHGTGLLGLPVTQLDAPFLLALRTIVSDVAKPTLAALKRLFVAYRDLPLFATNLLPEDFPTKKSAKGIMGELQSRIIGQAMSRAACVEVLRVVDEAYEIGKIDIGLYSFLNLCFHVYVRPLSYCKLILSDLQIDDDAQTKIRKYFLWLTPAKTGVNVPTKYCVSLSRMVGELLEAQRIHVIDTYGHLADKKYIGQLALFPARGLRKDGTWTSAYARTRLGALPARGSGFGRSYLAPILKLMDSIRFNFNGLRHTVGTQLAEAGCSAATIKAVLKHANEQTCQAYIDICFHGLITNLSESMRPGFDKHYPIHAFRSKIEPIAPERAIRIEDLETGRIDLAGECGREIACQYAPIACYACWRFTPCFDADHTINLDIVNREIERCEARGLPFKSMLDRSKDARRYIMLVVAASEQKRQAEAQGATA